MENLLNKIEQSREEKRRTNWNAYHDLCLDLARGVEVDPQEAGIVLDMVDKSSDELERDVETIRQRIAWRAELDKLPGIEKKLAQAQKEHEKAKAEFDKIFPKINGAVLEAYERVQELQAAKHVCEVHGVKLKEHASSPVIQHREQELHKRRRELFTEKRNIEGTYLDPFEKYSESRNVRIETQNVENSTGKYQAEHKSRLATFKERESMYQRRVDQIGREIAAIESELADIERKKLEP